MAMSREEAINFGIRLFTGNGAAVVRSLEELPGIDADSALVFARATFAEGTEFDRLITSAGPFWWVSFAEYERRGGKWEEYDGPEPGGLVRFDCVTGEVYHPPAL